MRLQIENINMQSGDNVTLKCNGSNENILAIFVDNRGLFHISAPFNKNKKEYIVGIGGWQEFKNLTFI